MLVCKLLDVVFSMDTLANSNAFGSRKAVNNPSDKKYAALDERKVGLLKVMAV